MTFQQVGMQLPKFRSGMKHLRPLHGKGGPCREEVAGVWMPANCLSLHTMILPASKEPPASGRAPAGLLSPAPAQSFLLGGMYTAECGAICALTGTGEN